MNTAELKMYATAAYKSARNVGTKVNGKKMHHQDGIIELSETVSKLSLTVISLIEYIEKEDGK